MTDPAPSPPRPHIAVLVLLGAITGGLSGLFGVGGGIVLIPLLIFVCRFPQRLASGTSMFAILPAAVSGGISYAVQGHVDWIAAAALAVGVVGGAQIGSALLARLPVRALRWMFAGFLLVAVASLWLVVPDRGAVIEITPLTVALLVVTGLLTGVLSGLMGIGGGVIVVPVLMLGFGASDLVAKGSSLIMMIPGSLSGTIGNLSRGNVDLRSGAVIGVAAACVAPLSTIAAGVLTPFWSNAVFSVLLLVITTQLVVGLLRGKGR